MNQSKKRLIKGQRMKGCPKSKLIEITELADYLINKLKAKQRNEMKR